MSGPRHVLYHFMWPSEKKVLSPLLSSWFDAFILIYNVTVLGFMAFSPVRNKKAT